MARRGSAPGFTPRSGSAPGLESLADAATFRLSEAEAAAAASDYQSQFGPWTSQVFRIPAPRSVGACKDQALGRALAWRISRSHTAGLGSRAGRRDAQEAGGAVRPAVEGHLHGARQQKRLAGLPVVSVRCSQTPNLML